MKSLLIKLTHGLNVQDILPQDTTAIDTFFAKGYLTLKENYYSFNSKYRAGAISLMQHNKAYLSVIGESVKDLLIEDVSDQKIEQGDLVIVQRLLGKKGPPSAKIVEIVGKTQSYSVGYIVQKDGRKRMVNIKNDHPVGAEISQDELKVFSSGDLFKIDNQTLAIMEKLGNISDPAVDEKIVLAQFNKHDEFEQDVLEIASSFKQVDASKYSSRKDLRQLPFCTIDPVTAKDFDDAIYWDEKNSVLFVAIADVSEYVTPFGAIDNEAIYRSFSIYLPHRSIPMLPRELSETLCSLQPNVDRLAYVFEINLDPLSLDVVSSSVYEALIHSKRRFNYDEVDAMLENRLQPSNESEIVIFEYLKKLKRVTDNLKKIRLKTGYNFRSSELEMIVDQDTNLITTEYAQETPSHALIEDCMLLANKEAAARFDRGVFRIHEPPSQLKLQKLYNELAEIGIFVDIKASLRETIGAIQLKAEEIGLQSEVDTLIIRSQMQARYSPLNSGHFGLGFEAYTHFTSPIRRYSDLIVHRLLKAIANHDTAEGSYVLRNIESLAMTISEKEREASTIEVEYMARKFARWANERVGEVFKARVVQNDPEVIAELHDEIVGAKIYMPSLMQSALFENITIQIDSVDLMKAKIFAKIKENV